MTNRVVLGNLGGGAYGLRVARPGYDVFNEPLGSAGIAFDTRLNDFGIIHAQGVTTLGTVVFTTLPYVPLASIHRIDASNRIITEDTIQTQIGSAVHWCTPFVGLVTQNTLTIRTFDIPYYTANFAAVNTRWLYTIYAIET